MDKRKRPINTEQKETVNPNKTQLYPRQIQYTYMLT